MKKSLVFAALAALAGCATVTTESVGDCFRVDEGAEPIESVAIDNTTWMLFSCIPLAGGDADNPNGCSCLPFRDTSTMENQMKMLQAEADRVGARKAVNVTTISTEEAALLFLIVREKLHTSAVLVK